MGKLVELMIKDQIGHIILNRPSCLNIDAAIMQENMIQTLLLQTEDHKEGISAFFGKRKVEFSGK